MLAIPARFEGGSIYSNAVIDLPMISALCR